MTSEEIKPVPSTVDNVEDVIKQQINNNDVVIYMKGTPTVPQCGYSARVVQIMNLINANYKTVDVLKDELIRQKIKAYSNWPTIPQIYFKGEFIGGCDILIEMFQQGTLEQKFESVINQQK